MQEPSKPIVLMSAMELETLIDRVITRRLPELTAPAPPDDLPELMSREQAAEFFKCSKGSIDGWARAGKITKHYVGNKSPRFKTSELRKIFDDRK